MKVALWIVGGVVLAIGLSIGGFALSVALSGPVGRGNQIKQVNNATNRTDQYNHFFDLNATFTTQVQTVKFAETQLAAFEKANPPGTPDPIGQIAQDRQVDQSNVTGAQQICVGTANTYNNDSQKTTTGAQFKTWKLPATLDPNLCEATQ